MRKYYIYFITLVCVSTGCSVYKPYERQSVNVSGLYRDPYLPSDTLIPFSPGIGDLPWQQLFREPLLQELIEEGLHNNTDLRVADLRVKATQAQLTAARLTFLPSLAISPQGTISSYDGNKAIKTWELPLVTSWEVDISGRLLNASRGAYATLLESDAYRQMVRTNLIATIATTYYTLVMLDEQVGISQETAQTWLENVRAMEAMKEAAMTNEAAVVQSRANYYQVLASLHDLERQIRETENALSVLLARTPREIRRQEPVWDWPEALPTGLPVELLSNRPDVRYAEMQVAVAWYATNQARSAFYPQLTISGSAGWTNSAGSAVANPAKIILSAVGSLTQPIFNKGQNMARLKVAEAQQEEAALNFQQTLLTAGQEVSDALFQYESASYKAMDRTLQVEELVKAVSYTQDLFRSGMSTYLEILTAQQSLLSVRLNQASDTYERIQAIINLYKALGGGRDMFINE